MSSGGGVTDVKCPNCAGPHSSFAAGERDVECDYCGHAFQIDDELARRIRAGKRARRGRRKRSTQRLRRAEESIWDGTAGGLAIVLCVIYGGIALYGASRGGTDDPLLARMLWACAGTVLLWAPQAAIGRAQLASYRRKLGVTPARFDDVARSQWTAETTRELEDASDRAERLARVYTESGAGFVVVMLFLVEFVSPAFMWWVAGRFL